MFTSTIQNLLILIIRPFLRPNNKWQKNGQPFWYTNPCANENAGFWPAVFLPHISMTVNYEQSSDTFLCTLPEVHSGL